MTATLSANEYRLLVENSPVMIWRAGLDAKCDYFNEPWLSFTGRTLEQEMGDGWADGVHPDDFKRCVDYYLDHFRRRQPFEMEYRLRRHDGVFRWIFDRGVPYTDERGEFAGFIGSCVDVDERRRAQEEREKRDWRELQLAQEFEHWVLGIVSHDIRNPLGAIDAGADILSHSTDDETRRIAERITRCVDRITNIVRDLLDVTRERHAGGIPVSPAPTDLAALCGQVVEEIRTFAAGRKIQLEGEKLAGVWDPHRITQAVSNLVGNAVKHGNPDKPIQVRVQTENDQAVIEVHNEGAIPRELMPTLFDPFSASAPSKRRDGLGLGLFIARSIARAHRGELHVDSSPERGTTFRLVLPSA